jgi:nicotinic acid phosphoribosyltransferase
MLPDEIKDKEINAFDREESVFKNWVKDTPANLRAAMNFDMGYWKVPKVVKDADDLQDCEKIVQENFVFLKQMFVNL